MSEQYWEWEEWEGWEEYEWYEDDETDGNSAGAGSGCAVLTIALLAAAALTGSGIPWV